MSSIRFIMGRMKVCFFAVLCVGLETWNSLQNLKSKIKHGHFHALFLPFNLYKSHYSCTLFPKNAVNKPIKNFMEVFENVLDSYIISKIETEFFGNGIFLESGVLSPLPKHTYALSNPYKINLFICLLIIPIRIDFCS